MPKKTSTLSVQLPEDLDAELRRDAVEHGKSMDGLVAAIVQTFMSMKKIERTLVYRNVPGKKFGRPLST